MIYLISYLCFCYGWAISSLAHAPEIFVESYASDMWISRNTWKLLVMLVHPLILPIILWKLHAYQSKKTSMDA
jgi:hypothetical protein